MTIAPVAADRASTGEAARRAARIVGVDVARCLALLGMMATHILVSVDPATGTVPWYQQVAGGRSAALFAVLAGVSLALVTGREHPVGGRRLAAARVSIFVRALIIAFLGLLLGGMDSGVAVILTYYGVLFVLALPFLGLGWRPLAWLAVCWAVGAPILSHFVRPHLPDPTYQVASLDQLVVQPGNVIAELTFTGYYPTVSWLAYLLAGLALGRLALQSRRTAAFVAGIGAAVALGAWIVSWVLVEGGARPTLVETFGPTIEARNFGSLDLALVHGFFGTTPTTSAWWLTIVAPHSTTPLDLLHTIGTAMLVLGVALLAGQVAPRVLSRVFAAGSMTLTLYTMHVLALVLLTEKDIGPERGPQLYFLHAIGALAIGAVWRAFVRQGPLEWFTTSVSRSASAAVVPLAPRTEEVDAAPRSSSA